MGIHIKTLSLKVRVERSRSRRSLNAAVGSVRPSMNYAMPMAEAASNNLPPEPSRMASEQRSPAGDHTPVSPSNVDASKVAERVYELMKQEAYLAQLRGSVRQG
jgi:hypothetical protein